MYIVHFYFTLEMPRINWALVPYSYIDFLAWMLLLGTPLTLSGHWEIIYYFSKWINLWEPRWFIANIETKTRAGCVHTDRLYCNISELLHSGHSLTCLFPCSWNLWSMISITISTFLFPFFYYCKGRIMALNAPMCGPDPIEKVQGQVFLWKASTPTLKGCT